MTPRTPRTHSAASQFLAVMATAGLLLAGCRGTDRGLTYKTDAKPAAYLDAATAISTPITSTPVNEEPAQATLPPRRLREPRRDEIWDLSLAEAIRLALQNDPIIVDASQFLSEQNNLLTNGDATPSRFDPAIQESSATFGRRGVEAALSDFDAQFTARSIWGRNELVQNSLVLSGGLPPGSVLVDETNTSSIRVEKTFASGGQFALQHDWNYSLNNRPNLLFGSSYTGFIRGEYRQPLLAGAGTFYTRVAGPRGNQALPNVDQGVVIARINTDIELADFELSARNLLADVEDAYWDLALAYHRYASEVMSRNATLETWRRVKAFYDQGRAGVDSEAQARDSYFEARERGEEALANLYDAEIRLRRMIGLPVNDGRVIRPADDASTVEFRPDWELALVDALVNRVELRRQKWSIKSLELQLMAATSLLKPNLDLVSSYQRNGFGDRLLDSSDDDGITRQGFASAYETLTQGSQTGWSFGFELTMPIGQRAANANVRNLELRLAKARAVLARQEREIAYELAVSVQSIDRWYQAAQTRFNRLQASRKRVDAIQALVDSGLASNANRNVLDELVRARDRLVRTEVAFQEAVIRYNQAITDFHRRKGTLLEHDNVFLAEDMWYTPAHNVAARRYEARSHAINVDRIMDQEPRPFAIPGRRAGQPDFRGVVPIRDEQPLDPDAARTPELPLPAPEAGPDFTNEEPAAPPLPLPGETADAGITAAVPHRVDFGPDDFRPDRLEPDSIGPGGFGGREDRVLPAGYITEK